MLAEELPATGAHALVVADGTQSLDLAIAAWLHAKLQRSGSEHTIRAYKATLESFRAALRGQGFDLDTPDARKLALVAQAWLGALQADGRPAAPSTRNQRRACISSFYAFARRRGLLEADNPMALLDPAKVERYGHAQPLAYDAVRAGLAAIDRTSASGKRDYALLSIALQTGRRAAELAALTCGDVKLDHRQASITWQRAKGGKVMHDRLPVEHTDALRAWLSAAYGAELGTLPHDAPVWRSLARNGTAGHKLTPRAISDICQKRLGTSKVHALRHTFAHAMEHVGAKVSEIQARLGHSSLETTGRYLAALRSAENAHAGDLAHLFGVASAPRSRAARTTRPLNK